MNVLNELLDWSTDRPLWQRDALRRLVTLGNLSTVDIEALTTICKSEHGLAGNSDVEPIAKDHIQTYTKGRRDIKLLSLNHKQGVNALATNQTLSFGPQLTVVYGNNAAGKSGYIRILKTACKSRGTETILKNILLSDMHNDTEPEFSITYTIDDSEHKIWDYGNEQESIANVSVFDRHCEAIYTTRKTEVAFRPFGLDLLDKLAKACNLIHTKLGSEQQNLQAMTLPLPTVHPNTVVASLLDNLSPSTNFETIRSLASLSEDDTARIDLLQLQLADAAATDPQKIQQSLRLRSQRLQQLANHLKAIDHALSPQSMTKAIEAKRRMSQKEEEAVNLRRIILQHEHLPGTGLDSWQQMWEAGRHFSDKHAYPDQSFPVTEKDTRCVLCQQIIMPETAKRMKQFEDFIISTSEREFQAAKQAYRNIVTSLNDLTVTDSNVEQDLEELQIADESLATKVSNILSTAEQNRVRLITALENDSNKPNTIELVSAIQEVESVAKQCSARSEALRQGLSDSEKQELISELNELTARVVLGDHQEVVLSEIARMRKVAAYTRCINDTNTRSITTKNTALTKIAVTQQLKASFQDELKKLKFKSANVELHEAGGRTGRFFHELKFAHSPGTELPKVLSEGESRCLSIAAFFAELSTADGKSAVVFDDPVSSFDYSWRDTVAQRLVAEAKDRQVVVFTHDIVFLLLLQEYAKLDGVKNQDVHIRRMHIGSGVYDAELPWVAMKVSARIGVLKNEWHAADKLFRNGPA